MLRSSLLVVAILIAGTGVGHAQVFSDPQPVAPIDDSGMPPISPDCASQNASDVSSPDCVPGGESSAMDYGAPGDYAPDYGYLPDYGQAPVYPAPFYVGVSLFPGYWGWPYYGWGFGWPYYSYCCYWGYSYAYASYGHGDHGHGHGGWDDHGGHGSQGYHGPYRYTGNGTYADQVRGSSSGNTGRGYQQARTAGSATAQTNTANFARAGALSAIGNASAGPQTGSPRFATPPNGSIPSQGRFAGRSPLASASYYAAARGGQNAAVGTRADPGATATNYRGSAFAGYTNGRGNDVTAAASGSSRSYRVASMPNSGYAATNGSTNRATSMQSGAYTAQRSSSNMQQRYAPTNRANASARGPMPSYSGARGATPSYYGPRGGVPYSRSGPGSAPRGSYARAPASGGGSSAHGDGHAGNSHAH